VEILDNVINKLYEGLNLKDIISEQAGLWKDRFLKVKIMKLLKERIDCAN
jgi:hypothetical protein